MIARFGAENLETECRGAHPLHILETKSRTEAEYAYQNSVMLSPGIVS